MKPRKRRTKMPTTKPSQTIPKTEATRMPEPEKISRTKKRVAKAKKERVPKGIQLLNQTRKSRTSER